MRPNTREAHSLPIHIGAEHGALGLGLFGAIFALTLRDLWRARRRLAKLRPDHARLVTGVMLAVVAFLTTSVFLHASFIRYQWFLLAVAAATARVMLDEALPLPGRFVRLVQVRDANPPPSAA